MGYTVGFRQNTSGYQDDHWPNANPPVLFLDNDFRNPDLDAFLELVDRYEPEVAVVGDATTRDEAEQYQQAATDLVETYGDVEPVIVPKCRDALDVIESSTDVGWPNGYANVDPLDYSELSDWRGRRIHVLGGSPHSQYGVIQLLTQPTLFDDPPADIVGLDGNGCFKAALYGEYWTSAGYKEADHLTLRETVEQSLVEIRGFWQERGVWPKVEPIDRYGPAVIEPDDHIFMDRGGDPIGSQEALESAYIGQYDDGETWAFTSDAAKNHFEYHAGKL